ncbi:MAG: hypothetical protein NVSMB18_36460 [Acetobacteraceae bacterium]
MAATGTLTPAVLDVKAVIGADFQATIALYTDVAQTTAFDLTGYTATVAIGGSLLVLTAGAELTVTTATGTIVATLTAVQTAALPGPGQHYTLKLLDGSGLISYPLVGTMFLALP